MDIFRVAERLMAMDDAAWARHANPWSVYTRFTCLPLLVAALWSRVWLGWWSLLPTTLALVWTWYNPRAFRPPATTDGWAARAVLGERLFLDRRNVPIPREHERAGLMLSAVSAFGVVPLAYGILMLETWPTLCGLVLVVGAKLWFVDRMARLRETARAER